MLLYYDHDLKTLSIFTENFFKVFAYEYIFTKYRMHSHHSIFKFSIAVQQSINGAHREKTLFYSIYNTFRYFPWLTLPGSTAQFSWLKLTYFTQCKLLFNKYSKHKKAKNLNRIIGTQKWCGQFVSQVSILIKYGQYQKAKGSHH